MADVTWRDLLAEARERLAGPEYPRFEAEELLARATGRPRSFFAARRRETAPAADAARFRELVARRLRGEPLQYVLGEWEFLGRTFAVDARALIPRGETEAIVEAARAIAPEARRVLDVGAGSGILAISLLLERPDAHAVAVDRSLEALALTRENAARFGVLPRLGLAASDWLGGLGAVREPFDLVVSNPPYVPLSEAPHLAKTVSEHEPPLALYGGEDGLDPLRVLLRDLPRVLSAGAPFVFEIGYGQAKDVSALVEASSFRLESIRLDAAGIPRTATTILEGR